MTHRGDVVIARFPYTGGRGYKCGPPLPSNATD
jgi:hypothetical protein